MFFCLKYLAPEQITGWAGSVLGIRCPFWRAQVITWLIGAKPFLEGTISQPDQFNKLMPDIQWTLSHALKGEDKHGRHTIPFVSDVNLETFRAACSDTLPAAERKAWIAQVTSVPLLHREMGYLAEQFAEFRLEV